MARTTARLVQNGLEVILSHRGRTERLAALTYPGQETSMTIFSQFAAMHLLAPHLPSQVVADFPIHPEMVKLIGKMYRSEHHPAPRIVCPSDIPVLSTAQGAKGKAQRRAIVSYSAGKDSQWNLWWAQEEYGKDNVLPVHISGLNRANGADERKYALRQSTRFGFDLEVLALKNGSSASGYHVMRSRDMFLVGILVPYARAFGARDILIEGFGEVAPHEPFTGDERQMRAFNTTLKDMGLGTKVRWKNRAEMAVVKDIYEHVPDWMEEVCNCFSANCFKAFISKRWKVRAPSFQMYDSQCGSCIKCRIVNVGRILYDPSFDASLKDTKLYVRSTFDWMREHAQTHKDMITPSFLRDLSRAAKKYDITPPKGM